MKRKILSLALALMMIISVAAALPVSAVTQADTDIVIEPREAKMSNGSYLFTTNTKTPTYDGMTWGDGEADDVFWYKDVSTFTYYIYGTITASKTGFYDVYIAAGTTTAVQAKFDVGTASTTGSLQATASNLTAMENNIGQVYLFAGEAVDYKLWATSGTSHTYIFDILLSYSDPQLESYEITATATEGGTVQSAGVLPGGSATITATPERGYVFDGWYDKSGTKVEGAGTTYTIDNVQADAIYTAKFEVGAQIEFEDYISVGSKKAVDGASGDVVYTSWTGINDNPSFTVPVTIAKSGYYDVEFVVNRNSDFSSLITLSLGDETIGTNSGTGVAAGYNAISVSNYLTMTKYTTRVYIPEGTPTLNVVFAQGRQDGGNQAMVYKFQMDYINFAYSDDQSVPAVVLGLDSGVWTSTNGVPMMNAVQTDASSWIQGKMCLINGAIKDTGVFENVIIPVDGWYDIYFGTAYWSKYPGGNFRMNISDGDKVIASDLAVGDVSAYTSTAAKSAMVASVYLTKGTHKITVAGTAGVVALVGMKFEYTGEDKTASSSITFTDKNGATVPSVAGGSDIFAEIATDVTGGKIFIAQYAGNGAEKTLVATSYATAAKSYGQASDKNVYRAQLKTVAGAGEVKAFLWTDDGECIPLAAAETLPVN